MGREKSVESGFRDVDENVFGVKDVGEMPALSWFHATRVKAQGGEFFGDSDLFVALYCCGAVFTVFFIRGRRGRRRGVCILLRNGWGIVFDLCRVNGSQSTGERYDIP